MPVQEFEHFVDKGIVTSVTPDSEKATSFTKQALQRKKYLVSIAQEAPGFIINEQVYDILMQLIRAKMIEKGFKAAGEGAHVAEVSYLRTLGATEDQVHFMNTVRHQRNQILYYGKIIERDFAQRSFTFMDVLSKLLV